MATVHCGQEVVKVTPKVAKQATRQEIDVKEAMAELRIDAIWDYVYKARTEYGFGELLTSEYEEQVLDLVIDAMHHAFDLATESEVV